MKIYQNILISLIFGLIGGIAVVAVNNYIHPQPVFYSFNMSKALNIEVRALLKEKNMSKQAVHNSMNSYIQNIHDKLLKFNKKGYVVINGVFINNNKVKDITSEILK